MADDFDQMVSGAMNALQHVLHMNNGDNVLVVTDRRKADIGKAFASGAKQLGGRPVLYSLPEEERPLHEIPIELLSLWGNFEITINAFEGFPEETPFRIKLSAMEMKKGAKVGHAPGINKGMMIEGPMNVDYGIIAKEAIKLMKAFKDATLVHITAPSGTDIRVNITDRYFETDVIIAKGMIGNLPAGEIWSAPVETDANGVIVCDGSIGDIGNVRSPLKITVKDGKAISYECADTRLVERVKELLSVDAMASVIGELGIGLNPAARLTGNLLEDEKAGGTAHIAFGCNIDMTNGKNDSQTHRDFLFHRPTFVVQFKDGSEKVLIKDGHLQV
ncbi:MAG: aminopeptidase [Methanomassiliicoccales archaeon]|nr:aminopeptidase [Methanomassiliicoccales archaeon]